MAIPALPLCSVALGKLLNLSESRLPIYAVELEIALAHRMLGKFSAVAYIEQQVKDVSTEQTHHENPISIHSRSQFPVVKLEWGSNATLEE